MDGCEHDEGSPMGKCAICERTVCSECYNEVFGSMICDLHRGMEDESEWALAGHYSQGATLDERRYALEENGITSLLVESEEEMVEVYVPIAEKEDAFATLSNAAADEAFCSECEIEYSKEIDACPVCGTKTELQADAEDKTVQDQEGW